MSVMIPIAKHQIGDYLIYIEEIVDVVVGLSPVRPHHLHVSFARTHGMPLPDVTGTLTIDSTLPADLVTGRKASVVLDSNPAIVVDMMTGSGTFPCVVGQTYTISDIDTNVTGDSLPSNVLTGTVPAFGAVPATPTGLAVTFAATP